MAQNKIRFEWSEPCCEWTRATFTDRQPLSDAITRTLLMPALKVSPRKPISMVSATAITSPADCPATAESPIRSPSMKLSTYTGTTNVQGTGP